MARSRKAHPALADAWIRNRLAAIAQIAEQVATHIRRHGMLRPADDRWECTPLKQLVGAAAVRHLSPDDSIRMQLDMIRGLQSLQIPVELRRRPASRRTRAEE